MEKIKSHISVFFYQSWVETWPQTLLSNFIAAWNFKFIKSLQELHQTLKSSIWDIATAKDQWVQMFCPVGKVLKVYKVIAQTFIFFLQYKKFMMFKKLSIDGHFLCEEKCQTLPNDLSPQPQLTTFYSVMVPGQNFLTWAGSGWVSKLWFRFVKFPLKT